MHLSDFLPRRSAGQDRGRRPLEPGESEPLSAIQADLDEAYRRFWDMMPAPLIGRLPKFSSRFVTMPASDTVRMNVQDIDDAIEVEAELPGIDEADVGVDVGPDSLVIRVERQAEHKAENAREYAVRERRLEHIERLVSLPRGIDPGAATATLKNGVLSVRIPKTAGTQADTKHVKVQVA